MKELIFTTESKNYAALLARITLGIVMLPHGLQKLFGWFNGFGFVNTMSYFTDQVGLPWILGLLVILIESIGALFLIAGLASRLSAFAIAAVSLGIVITQMHDYFFMNWFGHQKSEGAEFFILMTGLGIAVILSGGGAFSLDLILHKSRKE